MKIYINNNLLSLRPDTVISRTLQSFDIAEPTSRYITYTNTVEVDATTDNLVAFGIVNNHHQSVTPYQALFCRMIDSTEEIVGLAVIESVSDTIEFSMYFGSANFFESIKNKLISDFIFGGGVTWDADGIESIRNTSDGLVAPFIQYGQIDETDSEFEVIGNAYLPSVYYKTIIEGIIQQSGYTPIGTIFSDAIYDRLALAYSRDEFNRSEGYINARQFYAQITQAQLVQEADLDVNSKVIALTEVYDGKKNWFQDSRYTVPSTEHFKADFFATVTFQLISGSYIIKIRRQDGGSSEGVFFRSSATFTVPGTYTVNLQWAREVGDDSDADDYRLEVERVLGFPGDIKVLSGIFYNKVYGDMLISGTPTFEIEDILPDIEATELFAHFATSFGVLFFEKGKELHCRTLNEILKAKFGMKDWTLQRDKKVKPYTEFLPDAYAQINKYKYPSNDDFFSEGQADGTFIVANKNLEEQGDFYESIFNGSTDKLITNTAPESIIAVYIPIWEEVPPTDYTTEFENSPGLRLVYLRDALISDPTVKYGPTNLPKSDYKIAQFSPIQGNVFLANYMTKYVETLQKYKLVEQFYYLTDDDATEETLFKLIHDAGATYMVIQMGEYLRNASTKVTLLKVR